MPDIRVTYTGLVTFGLRLVIILVNMAFLLIVTRTLTVEEYGTWGLISNMLVYVVLAEVIVGYWMSRETARKVDSAGTGAVASVLLSGGGTGAYVVISLAVGIQAGVDVGALLFAAVLVPFRYLYGTLMKINVSWRPHTTSYALLIQSLLHIPLALIFVHHMGWGVAGVISSVVIAQAVCNAMLAAYVREKIRIGLDMTHVRRWFRLSWVSLYPSFAAMIFRLDVIALAMITGSVAVVALWTASFTVAFVITHSSLVAAAIYPKLLEGDGARHVRGNMTLFFYLGIPLAAVIMALAGPILFALNPAYQEAQAAMVILSAGMFLAAMTAIFQMILEGNERVDTLERASARDFAGSRLFLVPTVNVIQYGSYVAALVAVFLVLPPRVSDAELLAVWASLAVAFRIPAAVYQYRLARRDVGLRLEAPRILGYLGAAAAVFGAVFAAQGEYLVGAPLQEFLPALAAYAAAGMAGYFAITCAADPGARALAGSVIRGIRGSVRD